MLFIPVKLYIIFDIYGLSEYNKMQPGFFEFIFYTIIFIFFAGLSYIFFMKKSMKILEPKGFLTGNKNINYYFTTKGTIVSCFIIVILFLAYISFIGSSVQEILGGQIVGIRLLQGNQISFFMYTFCLLLLDFTFFSNMCSFYAGKKNFVSLLCVVVIYLLISFLSGSRGKFLDMALNILLARTLIIGYVSWKKIVIVFPILIVFFGFYDVIRQADLSTNALLDVILKSNLDIGDLLFRVVYDRTEAYFPNSVIYLQNQELFGLRYGMELLKVPFMLIPRNLFPERGVFFVQEFNDLLMLQTVGGTAFSPLVEAMVNFSYLGIPLYGIFGGFLLAILTRLYRKYLIERSVMGTFIIARICTAVLLLGFVEGGYGNPELLSIILRLVGIFIIYRIVKYKYCWK